MQLNSDLFVFQYSKLFGRSDFVSFNEKKNLYQQIYSPPNKNFC
jgi:hypothetical protein